MAFILPNGKHVDTDTIEEGMENTDREFQYYLSTRTGEVAIYTELDYDSSPEDFKSSEYVLVQSIPPNMTYQWMENFAREVVAPRDQNAAEKLSVALRGKDPFRHFQDALSMVSAEWTQQWNQYRSEQLHHTIKVWLLNLPLGITER